MVIVAIMRRSPVVGHAHIIRRHSIPMSVSPKVQILTAIAVATVMVASCMAFVPDTSEASKTDDYQYGNTFGMDLNDVNAYFVTKTGKTIDQLIAYYLNDRMPRYDINIVTAAKAEFALTRYTEQDGDRLDINDHLAGYFELIVDLEGTGPFPEAGTYEAEKGESEYDLFLRIFNEWHCEN